MPVTSSVPPAPGDADLVLEAVSKSFPGQRALDDVQMSVRPGEVHGLLGQNGSGKSTLIKVLAGYHKPDPGAHVAVAGHDLAFGSPAASLQAGLRFVHQNLGVVDNLTVVENMALASGYARRRSGRIDWPTQAARTTRLLAKLGVDLDVDRPLGECRAVERSAVAIARALDDEAGTIRFLILDEPTAALPPTEVEHLFEVVDEVRSQGIGVIYVSHRLDEIDRLTQRVTVLRDGSSQGTFDTSELDRGGLIELIVGHSVPALATAAGRTGAPPAPAAGVLPALTVRGLASATLVDASFEVARGEILGVAGLAGSGRDELAYALVGAVPATVDHLEVAGRAVLGGLDPTAAVEAGVALVPGNRQKGSAVFPFTVRENTTLPVLARYRTGVRISARREEADTRRWIERLEVQPPDPDRALSTLSGGNQQKVIIGKWLNAAPVVALLDEPTAGVDVGAREAIYDLVRARAAEGLAVVVSSSDVEDLAALCHRVVTFRDGRICSELRGPQVTEQALLHSMMGGDPAGAGALPPVRTDAAPDRTVNAS